MGLDMYLTAKKYFFNEDTSEYKKLQEVTGNSFSVTAVEFDIAYWRKANAIHQWFVTNVQGGNDDCGTYDVDEEDIQNLLNKVDKALKSSNPSEILPTQGGCFFGSTEYDESYLDDLAETKKMLEKYLNCKEKDELSSLYYQSSW
jgi:hypothetical protein